MNGDSSHSPFTKSDLFLILLLSPVLVETNTKNVAYKFVVILSLQCDCPAGTTCNSQSNIIRHGEVLSTFK